MSAESDDGRITFDAPSGTRTILVVDDERSVRTVMVMILESLGYAAMAVEDGASALAAVDTRGDLAGVLLDLSMPNIGGAEVLAKMRLAAPTLPVIVMSGYGERETIQRLSGQRADGYLSKPFGVAELERRLEAALPPLSAR